MPESTPDSFVIDAAYHGAEIEKVAGSIKDAGARGLVDKVLFIGAYFDKLSMTDYKLLSFKSP